MSKGEAFKDVVNHIKRVAPTLLKGGLGGTALALTPAAAAQAHSGSRHAVRGGECAPVTGRPLNPAESIVKRGILQRRQTPLAPNVDVVWGGGANNNTFDTTVPVTETIDGQQDYFRLVQTKPHASIRNAYKTIEPVQIMPPYVVEDGDMFTSPLSGDSLSSTTTEAVITLTTRGSHPRRIMEGDKLSASAYLSLTDNSVVLDAVGFTGPDSVPQDLADLAAVSGM